MFWTFPLHRLLAGSVSSLRIGLLPVIALWALVVRVFGAVAQVMVYVSLMVPMVVLKVQGETEKENPAPNKTAQPQS